MAAAPGQRTRTAMLAPIWKELVISAGALALAGRAGWVDWRTRRIPNRLTVWAFVVGLGLSTAAWGWEGAKSSLEGAGLALAVLLPFVLMRGLGAGDWKLMGALGAFLWPSRTVVVLLGTVLIAGVMAAIEMVRQRKVQETLRNLWIIFVAYITFHVNMARDITIDNPGLMTVPFGLAAALSTMLFFVVVSAIRIL